jgi:hypothetical protein
MSIECTGSLKRSLTEELADCLVKHINNAPGVFVVREEPNLLGLCFAIGDGPSGDEQITIRLSAEQIYVGFHAGTRLQRESVLHVVRTALDNCGISCDLEEE